MLFSSPFVAPTPAAPAWIAERLAYFADPRFTFDAGPHEYRLGERVLTSCTSWLKDYKEPFDAARIARSLALRRGCSDQEILAEWERAGWVGTWTHEFIEHYYNGRPGYTERDDAEVQLRYGKFLQLHAARLHAFEPVGGVDHLVPCALEQLADEEPVGGIVFDMEDPSHRDPSLPRRGC